MSIIVFTQNIMKNFNAEVNLKGQNCINVKFCYDKNYF